MALSCIYVYIQEYNPLNYIIQLPLVSSATDQVDDSISYLANYLDLTMTSASMKQRSQYLIG